LFRNDELQLNFNATEIKRITRLEKIALYSLNFTLEWITRNLAIVNRSPVSSPHKITTVYIQGDVFYGGGGERYSTPVMTAAAANINFMWCSFSQGRKDIGNLWWWPLPQA